MLVKQLTATCAPRVQRGAHCRPNISTPNTMYLASSVVRVHRRLPATCALSLPRAVLQLSSISSAPIGQVGRLCTLQPYSKYSTHATASKRYAKPVKAEDLSSRSEIEENADTPVNHRKSGFGKVHQRSGVVDEGKFVKWILVQGKRTYPDGRSHTGEFQNGVIHTGEGTYYHPNGAFADQGSWEKGVLKGKRVFADGSALEGEFRNGKIYTGTGKAIYPDGNIDEGNWVEGRLTGKRTYVDGTALEGEFREGRIFNGRGVLRRPNGDVDEGQWLKGELVGQFKRTYADGTTLEGEFRHGTMYNGQGVWRRSSGDVEEGKWVKGNLTGKRTYKDGSVLEGEFREGRIFNGHGVMLSAGATIRGQWVEGKLKGQGEQSWPNGSKITGEFREGRIYRGEEVRRWEADGAVDRRQWVDGAPVHCVRTHPDGRTLEGEFRGGKIWNGQGLLRHADGTADEGQWVEGVLTGQRTGSDGKVVTGTFEADSSDRTTRRKAGAAAPASAEQVV